MVYVEAVKLHFSYNWKISFPNYKRFDYKEYNPMKETDLLGGIEVFLKRFKYVNLCANMIIILTLHKCSCDDKFDKYMIYYLLIHKSRSELLSTWCIIAYWSCKLKINSRVLYDAQ